MPDDSSATRQKNSPSSLRLRRSSQGPVRFMLASEEALSTTIISRLRQLWRRHESIASASQAAPFLQGMMTETNGNMGRQRRAGLLLMGQETAASLRWMSRNSVYILHVALDA